MTYPKATPGDLEFFRHRGWIVVQDAIPQGDLDQIERGCVAPGRGAQSPRQGHHLLDPVARRGCAQRLHALTNHLQAVGAGGEGDHYAWRVCVNQRTGERSRPGR